MIFDPALDALLALDGQVIVIDTDGRYWVKSEVSRVAAIPGSLLADLWAAVDGVLAERGIVP